MRIISEDSLLTMVFVFLSQFNEFIPYEAVYDELAVFVKSGVFVVSVLAFLGLLIAWLLSIAWTFIIYGDFRIKIVDDHIVITRGLLEKKQVTVPLNRVQGLRVVENPIRQLLGYCTVHIENAGGSVLEKDSTSIKLFPIVKKKRITGLLNDLFPDYVIHDDFKRLPGRSLRRYVFRQAIWVVVPTAAVCFMYWPYGLWVGLLMIPFGILGYYQYRAGGWKIVDGQLSKKFINGFSKFVKTRPTNERKRFINNFLSFIDQTKGLKNLNAEEKSMLRSIGT